MTTDTICLECRMGGGAHKLTCSHAREPLSSNPLVDQHLSQLPPEFDEAGKHQMREKARRGLPEAFADMSDEWVADRVRMLLRNDIWHEAICTAGRDRIMRLSLEVERLRAGRQNSLRINDNGAKEIERLRAENAEQALQLGALAAMILQDDRAGALEWARGVRIRIGADGSPTTCAPDETPRQPRNEAVPLSEWQQLVAERDRLRAALELVIANTVGAASEGAQLVEKIAREALAGVAVETSKPARDAEHCDYPDCEQHWRFEVERLRAALQRIAQPNIYYLQRHVLPMDITEAKRLALDALNGNAIRPDETAGARSNEEVSYEEARMTEDGELIRWAFDQPQRLVRELAIRFDALIEKYEQESASDEATIHQLKEAIYWALGERDDFPEEPPPLAEKYRRRYHWRSELRRRSGLPVGGMPPEKAGGDCTCRPGTTWTDTNCPVHRPGC